MLRDSVPVADGPVAAWLDRLIAATVLAVAVGAVWMLAGIAPDPRGHGTHEQLGMTPCGWATTDGIPCPTCGVTTAATRLVHLDLVGAFLTQPFGTALALAGLLAAGVAGYCLVWRRSYVDIIGRLPYGTILVGSVVLLLGSWLYKYLTFTP